MPSPFFVLPPCLQLSYHFNAQFQLWVRAFCLRSTRSPPSSRSPPWRSHTCPSTVSERKPEMAYEDCLVHVLEDVLSRDLPDEVVGQALADEAEHRSGGGNE